MIRLIMVLVVLVGFLIVSYPFLVAQVSLGKKDPHARDLESIRVVRAVFRCLLKLAGVTITVKGEENIPKDTAVLYVAKKEMEKIPILRTWMVNVNCLFLDRKNIKEGLKTILQGIEKVKNGISIWIFPEGTRNTNEDIAELLPFKEGSLKIAEKSGCPVIPVAMTGTAEVLEKHFPFITPSHITVYYGKPINIKELDPEDRKHPGAYTRNVLIGMLKEMQEEK